MFAAVKKALLVLVLATLGLTVESATVTNKIKHVIVLMLENRSFDHMLGMLKKQNPAVDGCLPNAEGCSNPLNPADPTSATVTVDDTAVYEQTSPSHSISGTSDQIYGTPDTNTVPLMNGFISSYDSETTDGTTIMKCFAPEHVPAISTLASEYAVYDGYFASIPGPTEPNRCYAMSATSHGMGNNDVNLMVRGMPQKTIFRQVEEMGLDYRIYMEQVRFIHLSMFYVLFLC
jgi:phospholipase C